MADEDRVLQERGGKMDFGKSQLKKTMRILQKRECSKTDSQNQVKKTLNTLRGKK